MDGRTEIPPRLGRLHGDERGIALISAIGILAVLTALGVSAIAYSSSNYRSAELSSADGVGGHVAEAGFSQAVAILANASNPVSPSALPPGSATLEGGTVSWSGILAGDVWTITAVSTVKNPTGAGDLRRTVRGKARIGVDPAASGNEAWNYVYADDLSTCTRLENNVTLATPLFVRGDLCLQNSAQITGSPVRVGGKITLLNSASVGTPAARVSEVHVGGGCALSSSGPWVSPCGDAQRVYATTVDASPGTISKPPVDLAKWYSESRPGPLRNCTSGSFPGGFDNDGLLNRSRPSVDLMPATPYDCSFTEGPHVLGRIAWTPGSPGQLTVLGTIFFDGDIMLTSGAAGVYSGRGVIYSSGRIEVSNTTSLCGVADCNETAWDPNANLLVFVAGSSTDSTGFLIQNNAKFQGALYVVTDYKQQNLATMQGPVIARQVQFQNHAGSWAPIWSLVAGTPSASTSTTVMQVSGSWSG